MNLIKNLRLLISDGEFHRGVVYIGVAFPNRLGGGVREWKVLKVPSKSWWNRISLKMLCLFLPSLRGGGSVQHEGGGGSTHDWGTRALPKRYKVTPLRSTDHFRGHASESTGVGRVVLLLPEFLEHFLNVIGWDSEKITATFVSF